MASRMASKLRLLKPRLDRFITSTAARNSILDQSLDDVVITFAKRSAMGRAKKGQLKDTPVDELLAGLIKAALQESRLNPSKIGDIAVGTCHLPSPLYISRAAALAAGVPDHVPIQAINRLCSSGLMAIRSIAHAIQAGEADVGLAVGVESMSLHPRPSPAISQFVGANSQAQDACQPMGWTSEMVAQDYGISREKQDSFALISHTRAARAIREKKFTDEIIPIDLGGRMLTEDDTVRVGVTTESLSSLKPVFPDWGKGTTTAGNASGVGDGAGLLILASRKAAEREGLQILGKWVDSVVVGVEPRHMGVGPVKAIPKLMQKSGLTNDDIDLFEINEAFASQFAYCVETLDISMEKINPNGGAIALSHPLGMTGVRQVITGLAELRRLNKSLLCTSMCVGSGMGAAALFVNEVLH